LIARQRRFCIPWWRHCGNHAKCCMDGKTIRCLPNPSQHVPICLQQFHSYSNRKCKKMPFVRTAAHIFVSPGDAPGAIMLNFTWIEREFDAYKLSPCMYTSNSNRFRDIARYRSKIAKLSYHTCIYRPRWGWPRQNFASICISWKTRMMVLSGVKEFWWYV